MPDIPVLDDVNPGDTVRASHENEQNDAINTINDDFVKLHGKQPCRVATTANITLSGTQTIDGVSVVAGDRVLVKDQSTGSQNGIYVCAAGAWSRSTDFDATSEVFGGSTIPISEGTANGNKIFILTTDGTITVGTTSLAFSEISGGGGGGGLEAGQIIMTTSITPDSGFTYTNNTILRKRGDSWQIKKPLGTARAWQGAGVIGTDIYVVGGEVANYKNNDKYDTTNDTWTNKADMSTERSGTPSVGVYGGKLYVAGGITNGGTYLTTCEEYTPGSPGSWANMNSMTTGRCYAASAYDSTHLYVFGGMSAVGTPTNSCEKYNMATNTWSSASNTGFTSRWSAVAALVNGVIYVFGGKTSNNAQDALRTVEAYNISGNTWSTKASMPKSNRAMIAIPVGNYILIIGGISEYNYSREILVYDTVNDIWYDEGWTVPTERMAQAYGIVSGVAYIFTGWNGGYMATNEAFTLPTLAQYFLHEKS